MSARLPPNARRMAISFPRVVPRASIMFATLSEAINSTTPATASSKIAGIISSEPLSGAVEIPIRGSGWTRKV